MFSQVLKMIDPRHGVLFSRWPSHKIGDQLDVMTREGIITWQTVSPKRFSTSVGLQVDLTTKGKIIRAKLTR